MSYTQKWIKKQKEKQKNKKKQFSDEIEFSDLIEEFLDYDEIFHEVPFNGRIVDIITRKRKNKRKNSDIISIDIIEVKISSLKKGIIQLSSHKSLPELLMKALNIKMNLKLIAPCKNYWIDVYDDCIKNGIQLWYYCPKFKTLFQVNKNNN